MPEERKLVTILFAPEEILVGDRHFLGRLQEVEAALTSHAAV